MLWLDMRVSRIGIHRLLLVHMALGFGNWKSIVNTKAHFNHFISFELGLGEEIRFGEDDRCSNSLLRDDYLHLVLGKCYPQR